MRGGWGGARRNGTANAATTIASSYCNAIAITIGDIICFKKTKDFHKVSVLMTSSVEILFESTGHILTPKVLQSMQILIADL